MEVEYIEDRGAGEGIYRRTQEDIGFNPFGPWADVRSGYFVVYNPATLHKRALKKDEVYFVLKCRVRRTKWNHITKQEEEIYGIQLISESGNAQWYCSEHFEPLIRPDPYEVFSGDGRDFMIKNLKMTVTKHLKKRAEITATFDYWNTGSDGKSMGIMRHGECLADLVNLHRSIRYGHVRPITRYNKWHQSTENSRLVQDFMAELQTL